MANTFDKRARTAKARPVSASIPLGTANPESSPSFIPNNAVRRFAGHRTWMSFGKAYRKSYFESRADALRSKRAVMLHILLLHLQSITRPPIIPSLELDHVQTLKQSPSSTSQPRAMALIHRPEAEYCAPNRKRQGVLYEPRQRSAPALHRTESDVKSNL